MKCPKCQKNNLSWADYCVWCGTPLFSAVDARGRPLSSAEGLPEVKRHLNEMAARLSKVETRVERISQHIGLEVAGSPAAAAAEQAPKVEVQAKSAVEPVATEVVAPEPLPPVPVLEPTPVTPETLPAPAVIETAVVQETVASGPKAEVEAESVLAADKVTAAAPTPMRLAPARVAETPPVAARPPQKPPRPPQPSQLGRRMREWEQSLPGNWLSRIGIVALFIGLGFLAKLAYDRGWVNQVVQLLAGVACGGVLLAVWTSLEKKYRVWAQAVTGGGIAVLYLSIFASYALNDLMGFLPTFALMFLVTVLAVGIALRRESMAIAIIGIVGAFLAPIVLGASDLNKDGGASPVRPPGADDRLHPGSRRRNRVAVDLPELALVYASGVGRLTGRVRTVVCHIRP